MSAIASQTHVACPYCHGTTLIYPTATIDANHRDYELIHTMCGEMWWPNKDLPLVVDHEVITVDEPPQRGRPRKLVVTVAVTHCPQGHEYTPENTYMNGGSRNCRACRVNKKHLSREEQKARCKRGHLRTTENTMIQSNGVKRCMTCLRDHAEEQRKEVCQRGHVMTADNIKNDPHTSRRWCRACLNLRERERRAKKRQEANKLWQQQKNGVAA